ncbi:class IV adenylate cyclase [Nocardiopsis lambiniae]|uniref:CYTH domain-containing protein n=1 Tax=Nocardiopsis lambiniae TaxID=3075539 RepID=A0ABU2M777_9ACTN|nr:CYTH domain-containing protein [Nocardiopsis sp. DSM 44743]MDT0328480.1 CYTH domain-containing protein [Nocardiopsis sp. DSM 44743]
MREIEAKYQVRSGDGEALSAALKRAGVELGSPVHQDDQAYAPEAWAYGLSKVGVPFARLRTTQDGRHLFTVKTPVSNEMECSEAESIVADRQQMHEALVHMGFRPTVRIVKTRCSGTVGEWSVCVDEVESAGLFIEVEATVTDDRDGLAVQAELDAWVRALEVPVERTTDTYDSLVRAARA